MSEDKAILILDEMPKNCFFCPLQADIEWFGGVCSYDHYMGRRNRLSRHGNHNPSDESRPEWCPLRPLPKKWERQPYNSQSRVDWKIGYNDCLDDIQGIEDEQERANKWWEEHSSRFD